MELDAFNNEIESARARKLLTNFCRIPKNLVTPLLNEMEKLGWIKFGGFNKVSIIKRVDCDILPRKHVWVNHSTTNNK